MGLPIVGCECAVCKSGMSRLRPSILVEENGKKLLIDVTPDFRQQALLYPILPIDAIVLTHAHFDHIAGIPDLRPIIWKQQHFLSIYTHSVTRQYCEETYFYTLRDASIEWRLLEEKGDTVATCPVPFDYLTYHQGHHPVVGLRFGDTAYVTDILTYNESELMLFLKGIKNLIISCHPFGKNHLGLEEVQRLSEKSGAHATYLTHLDHYFTEDMPLPPRTYTAFDGMMIPYVRT